MPQKQQAVTDSAAVVQVPEPMVMHRADGSSQGSISSASSSTKRGNSMKTTIRTAHSSGSSSPGTDPQRRPQRNSSQRGVTSSDENTSGSILTAPLAWVQRTRERRRRLHLQNQAEEQLRKIAEAERLNPHSNAIAIATNGSAGSHAYHVGGGDDLADDELKIGTQHLSKSGEGMTGELDWDLEGEDEDEFLIPKVRIHPESRLLLAPSEDSMGSPSKAEFKVPAYILTPEQMHQIAIHVLPRTIAYCQWRRIYSLNRDGDSFKGCLRIMSDVARTLMVVRTTRGAVFGGYADSPWRPHELGGARFYGSAQACLFSVKEPDKKYDGAKSPKNLLNVYRWSGKNRYIQLCDSSSKMLAFGGGGADGAFGLCVQDDFQSGSTGSCDTFDNAPLCDQGTFEIVDVEFWEFLTGVF